MSDGVERLGRRNVRHSGNPFRNLGHCAWFQCWSQSAIMTVAKHSLADALPGGTQQRTDAGWNNALPNSVTGPIQSPLVVV